MIKAYNSFIDLIYKVIELIIMPVLVVAEVAFFYNVKIALTDAPTIEESLSTKLMLSAIFMAFIIVGILTITDHFSFGGIFSKKYSGIEYMKSSKKCSKMMMDVIYSQIVIRTVVIAVTYLLAVIEIYTFADGFYTYKEVFEGTFPFIIFAWSMMSLAVFIVRFTRNQQIFIIVTYGLFQLNLFAIILLINRGTDDMMKYVLDNTTIIAFVVYGTIGIVANILIVWRMKKMLKKSWFNDEGVLGVA